MCLVTKDCAYHYTGEKEIVCYKVLCVDKNGKYYSPYKWKRYKIGKTYNVFFHKKVIEREAESMAVYGGFIHTYSDFDTASTKAKYMKEITNDGKDNFVIVRCVIPKHTHYYSSDTCYASRKLRLIHICEIIGD